jgi:glycosidase
MELPAGFWEEWRALVKSINPDAFISGEIWHRADEWLGGKHFDAVMNYRFADPVVAWVGNLERKLSVSALDARLAELRLAYPDEATYALMNLVGSHDTDRIASMLLNRDRPYDRSNQVQRRDDYDSGRPHDVHFQRQRLVALTQMTYVGAPMIYYGDEVGMWGADDPTNRKPMLWRDLEPYANPEQNFIMEDHLAFYREAVGLRRAHAALRVGAFRTLVADDEQDLWVFERRHGDEVMLVALNAGSEAASFSAPAVEGAWQPVFGEAPAAEGEGAGTLHVGPIAGRVWRRDR